MFGYDPELQFELIVLPDWFLDKYQIVLTLGPRPHFSLITICTAMEIVHTKQTCIYMYVNETKLLKGCTRPEFITVSEQGSNTCTQVALFFVLAVILSNQTRCEAL